MDFFYFLVTSSKAWDPRYHQNFFNTEGAFGTGFFYALVLGLMFALIFYFGCCNNSKSSSSATLPVWLGFLLVSAVVAYFAADWMIIGKSGEKDRESIFYKSSFYQANEEYFIKQSRQNSTNTQLIKELTTKKNEIKSALDKGGDVRFDFCLTTAALCMIFFYFTSLLVKSFTINGKTVPHQWPMKS